MMEGPEDWVCQSCGKDCFGPHPEEKGRQRGMGCCSKCREDNTHCMICLTMPIEGRGYVCPKHLEVDA